MLSAIRHSGCLIPILMFVCFVAAAWRANYVSKLPVTEAERLISKAPEFGRYARLFRVESVHPGQGSLKRSADGQFYFNYLDAPSRSPVISARVHFAYWRGAWHLSNVDYGCPGDCHSVHVYNDPRPSAISREQLIFNYKLAFESMRS